MAQDRINDNYDTVSEYDRCACGENRIDYLVIIDEDRNGNPIVHCLSCDAVYTL